MKRFALMLSAAFAMAAGAENLVPEGKRDVVVPFKEAGKMSLVYTQVKIPAGTEALLFTAQVKYADVVPGAQKWFDARIISDWFGSDFKKVKSGPAIGGWKGTHDWIDVRKTFEVPAGVAGIALMPCLFNVKSGSFEVRNMSLEPISGIAAATDGFKWSETLPIKTEWTSAPLQVKGNRLTNAKTLEEVWLQGVAVPSLEWGPGGDNILKSVTNLVEEWNVNVIRLALHSSYWFGTGKWQNPKTGAAKYHALVDEVADYMQSRGKYLVVDLHEYRAPVARHAAFWKDVATRYKNHPGVIFGLLNEPHDISWEIWRNGGVTGTEKTSNAHAENKEKLVGENSIGMQMLVKVIRRTGAKNLLSAGGLDWAYDLSGILNGYALDDGNLMYESHVYPWKRHWKKAFLDVAEKYPVLLGEVGAQDKPMPFEKPQDFVKPEDWVPGMLATIQEKRINWTAWCFHPKASPCLITGWDYEPTPYWGVHAMAALRGEKKFKDVKTW
ncbi:MAG: cellulase family glycosylhydrolase [Kiritimatiellae bacterium]|nr:cellulase family glycosylhydrolase [Kiritimatiellia bacterium]